MYVDFFQKEFIYIYMCVCVFFSFSPPVVYLNLEGSMRSLQGVSPAWTQHQASPNLPVELRRFPQMLAEVGWDGEGPRCF